MKIYGIEKTIADCFKFRNKIGSDVAMEALRAYRKREGFNIGTLLHYARIDRVERVIKPYLEAIVCVKYRYVTETIQMLPQKPDENLVSQLFRKVAALGSIHPPILPVSSP